MNKNRIIAIAAAAAAVLVIAAGIIYAVMTRPLVTAPKGTAPLDNKLDTAAVAHLVVDEGDVLAEETEKIIAIYNANWSALAGRRLAVVTVENTENAEDDAWQWAQRLSLGGNDALLLMETGSGRDCALVANGSSRDDLATLKEGYLERLTYMPCRAGDFDEAALAVCQRMHYFYGYDGESHRRANVTEGVTVIVILALFVVPFLFFQAAEKIDNRRFRRWHTAYGVTNPPAVPWKTMFFWHRTGSKWYEVRISGEWVDYSKVIRKARKEKHLRNMSRNGRFR